MKSNKKKINSKSKEIKTKKKSFKNLKKKNMKQHLLIIFDY